MKIARTLSVDGFKDYVAAIQSCGGDPLPGLTQDVLDSVLAVIDCYIEDRETREATEGRVIVQLPGGQVGVFSAWSDSSGHGWQRGAGWVVYPSLEACLDEFPEDEGNDWFLGEA